MGLFSKDDGGFKRVTICWGSSVFREIVTRRMTEEEIIMLLGKLDDQALAQRIKAYMKKHEVIQKSLSDMPKFTSQAQFEAYVSKEFSLNAEAALLSTSLLNYLIVAEKK